MARRGSGRARHCPQAPLAAAAPFMGYALDAMRGGAMRRVQFLCKASLFLNRLTELYDGVSFILEANPKSGTTTC